MAKPRKHDGVVYTRSGTKILWMSYLDRNGKRIRESTFTKDWQEANKKLRKRRFARDDKVVEIVKRGEQLGFEQWVDFFLENYSKPPLRVAKTHELNMRAAKHLKNAFHSNKLADLNADEIELYLRKRLRDRIRVKTGLGVYRAARAQARNRTPGTSGPPAHAEHCRQKKTSSGECLRWSGVFQ